MRKITKHIIHCSDSRFGDAALIDKWHKARGFKKIGYHFVILPNGKIEKGRELEEVGAHTKGVNKDSIGTCLIGVDKFTEEQFIALRMLHEKLCSFFAGLRAYPHSTFNAAKSCPNFNVDQILYKDTFSMKIKDVLPVLSQVIGFILQKGKFNTAFATTTVASSAVYSEELLNFVESLGSIVFDAQSAELFVSNLTSGGIVAVVAGVFAGINLFMSYKQKQ